MCQPDSSPSLRLSRSHVANVLARLRRICDHYGSRPAFILASATIANPGHARSTRAGRPVSVIEEGARPTAERGVDVWTPPLLDAEFGIRASTLGEAATLLAG